MAPAPKTAPSPNSSQSPPPPKSPPYSPPPPPSPRSPPPSSPSPPPPPPPRSPPLSSPPPPTKGPSPPQFQSPPQFHRSPPPPTRKMHNGSSHKQSSNTSNGALIVGLAIAGFVFVTLVTICIICCCRKKKKKQKVAAYYSKPPPGGDYYKTQWPDSLHEHVIQFTRPEMIGIPVGVSGKWAASPRTAKMPLAFNMNHFSYNELSAATDGFSQANLLGQGGFGYVHKGILANGHEVAVKSLKSGSNQGNREFQAEVEIISRVHHKHLVSLVGYCIADAQRILVYEFVPNKTLDFHLHGKHCPVMKWETRMRIARGSAKGLAYLHEDCDPRIIHRDIKSSNILLDYNFDAKVADFGLAKLASVDDTHISTRVVGTFGYLAPEYASSGKLTEKSDVFSFGVMLLELLSGRKPIDPTSNRMEEGLVEWAGPLIAKALEHKNYNGLVDPRLEGNFEPQEVALMVSCTAASIRHSAKRRPKMSQIMRVLEGDGSSDTLNDALKPQRMESTLSENQSPDTPTSIVHDTMAYNNDMKSFVEKVTSSDKTSKEASS